MLATTAWLLLAAILLAAAALKAADRTGSTVALAAYGIPGRLAAPAFATLVAVEAALAAGIAAGIEAAAYAGALLLAGFLVVQVVALARGGGGAPCGCFGSGGRLSRGSAGRTALLACACAVLPVLGAAPQLPLVLTAAVAAAVVVLAAGRRSAPLGALEIDGEGPALNEPSPLAGFFDGDGDVKLALFTSPGCALCKRVAPAADELGVPVKRFDEAEDTEAWAAARVPGAPFAVALDERGVVLAKGTVNDARQLASIVDAARARRAPAPARDLLAPRVPQPRRRRRRGRGRRRHGRRRDPARRRRGLPLLRPHLHDRRLPAPDRAAADRPPRAPPPRPRRPQGRRPRPADRRPRQPGRRGRARR